MRRLVPMRTRVKGREVLELLRPPRTAVVAGVSLRLTGNARYRHDDRDYQLLRALAATSTCIFDVGAYVGITALLMADAAGPEAKVWAFDASDVSCRTVEANARLNGFEDRINTVSTVVGDRSGAVVDFYSEVAMGGSASVVPGYLGNHQHSRKVSITLDDFAVQVGAHPDLVKIDVEGGERSVLAGMQSILRHDRPTLLVEMHSWAGTTLPQNVATLLPVLDASGYEMIFLERREVVRDPDVLAHRGRCHALVLPAGTEIPPAVAALDTSLL